MLKKTRIYRKEKKMRKRMLYKKYLDGLGLIIEINFLICFNQVVNKCKFVCKISKNFIFQTWWYH